MLRALLAILSLVVGLAPGAPARADDSPLSEFDRAAIRSVIEAQLAAFQADDGETAFGFASPSIQQQFGDPDTFLAMVKAGYLPVYRAREVQFQRLVEYQGEPVQLVLLVGPDLAVVTAYYIMQRQADGSWRIDGCVLGEAPDQAT
jgi:Domain of unknown function (DUF4864)